MGVLGTQRQQAEETKETGLALKLRHFLLVIVWYILVTSSGSDEASIYTWETQSNPTKIPSGEGMATTLVLLPENPDS